MAKKKNITAQDLLEWYMDKVLEDGNPPQSVYKFAKDNNFDESKFYEHFGSFEAMEDFFMKRIFDLTLEVLDKDEQFDQFSAKDKLLSFYYTFFGNLAQNRSFTLYLFGSNASKKVIYQRLMPLKKDFKAFVQNLEVEMIKIKEKNLERLQNKSLDEGLWGQFLFIFEFWLNDRSAAFEKTDLLIEKSLKAGFDFIESSPLHSLLDLGKFMWKEKFTMN